MGAPRRAGGFTLLEVLVALSIFALIGIASYRVLSSVLQADEHLQGRSEELRKINRAFWLMQEDIEQLMHRPVRDGEGGSQPYLMVDSKNPWPLLFTRGGRANPLGLARSSMLRVAYAVDHHPDYDVSDSPHYHEEMLYLLRYSWPQLDGSGIKEKAQVQVLLADVESMTVSVLDANGEQLIWPVPDQASQQPAAQAPPATGGEGETAAPTAPAEDLPVAVQIELTHTHWGEIKRLFKVW